MMHSFREGAVTYKQGVDGKFYFSVHARNGEIVSQSEGYETLASAKNGARATKEALNVEEEDE